MKILTGEPVVAAIGEMALIPDGIAEMTAWVRERAPECVDEADDGNYTGLFPHHGFRGVEGGDLLSDNELLVELAGRKCYDEATEVLTPNGWCSFAQLEPGVPVATFDRKFGVIEFQVPTDYISKVHEGAMYCVESRAISLRVTADHEMWHQSKDEPWSLKKAHDLVGKRYRVRRSAPYTFMQPFNEPLWDVPQDKAMSWATFMGYFLAEGSLVDGKKYGTGSRVIVYQRPEAAEACLAAMADLGFEPYIKKDPRNGVLAITINNTKLSDVLSALGKLSTERRLPQHVFQWPMGIRAALLDALMAGDGTLQGTARIYVTTSKELADGVQRLILLSGLPGSISETAPNDGTTGFKGNHTVYRVREGSKVTVIVNNKARHDRIEENVSERVYCVSVPNRILVVRRNNKIVFCANCYNSFGLKAGRKSNREYIANTQQGDVPHASIVYHAKMSFFIGGVSRRVSHELIRHYVGADRDEEGSPSQESTRYVEHSGCYIAHPAILNDPEELDCFKSAMSRNYAEYLGYIERRTSTYTKTYGNKPAGMDRKRIFESASPYLSHACETSFIWTTNPIALAKMLRERDHEAADLEYLRLAKKWKSVALKCWPNLFPQVWLRS